MIRVMPLLLIAVCSLSALAQEAPAVHEAAASNAPASSANGIDEKFFAPGGALDQAGDGNPERAVPASPSLELGTTGVKVLGALVFISLLIVGLHKLGRKARIPFLGAEGIVKKIAMEPIGPNQFINVVEIGGKVIVLGQSEKGITMLTELNGDELDRVRLAHSESSDKEPFRSVFRSMGN